MKTTLMASALALSFALTAPANGALFGKKTTPVVKKTEQTTEVKRKPVLDLSTCKGSDPAKMDLTKPFPTNPMSTLSNRDKTDLIALAKQEFGSENIAFMNAVDKLRQNMGENGWARVISEFVARERANFGQSRCWALHYSAKLKEGVIKISDPGIRGSLRALYSDAAVNVVDTMSRISAFQEKRKKLNSDKQLDGMVKSIESGKTVGGSSQLMKNFDPSKVTTTKKPLIKKPIVKKPLVKELVE